MRPASCYRFGSDLSTPLRRFGYFSIVACRSAVTASDTEAVAILTAVGVQSGYIVLNTRNVSMASSCSPPSHWATLSPRSRSTLSLFSEARAALNSLSAPSILLPRRCAHPASTRTVGLSGNSETAAERTERICVAESPVCSMDERTSPVLRVRIGSGNSVSNTPNASLVAARGQNGLC